MSETVSIREIEQARDRLKGHVKRTPLGRSNALSKISGTPVFLKLENRQTTGSFKLRGATNAVLSLPASKRMFGVVAASTGNHGRALAHAASLQGLKATICLSSLVPPNKVEAIHRLGADIRIVGKSQDDAMEEVARLSRDQRMNVVPPFDDPHVIAGQGTVGLELLESSPEIETVLIPLSGGGLASGIAAAVKALKPKARLIGISMQRGAAMQASLAKGHPVNVEEVDTLADSLGGGIGLDNRWTFAMCRDLLDDVILLEEEEIAAGVRHMAIHESEIIEGAAAVGVGALLSGKLEISTPTAIIVSGGNIDPKQHRIIMSASVEGAN
ncbi:hydroxyectoine utilization dehydratase EutB [Ochrobactrum sp. RH2CCR150]|uniref:hydroxyectoine utilization dehydratase EutB n=1 Tax=Ochrobactrum sp. RH2CCR150 TaxID=2587044 RepID=UPI0015FD6EB9|nr:threonine dehydratase [Ochrobactrum sp. RH2CCR150]